MRGFTRFVGFHSSQIDSRNDGEYFLPSFTVLFRVGIIFKRVSD